MDHHTWLIFVFLVETGFHHIGQAGLELLTSSDLPALASQCWDYKREPPRLAGAVLKLHFTYVKTEVMTNTPPVQVHTSIIGRARIQTHNLFPEPLKVYTFLLWGKKKKKKGKVDRSV